MNAVVAKRAFLRALVAATVVSALYAIAVFLGGHFSDTSRHILATTSLIALSSGFCLACSAVWEKTRQLAAVGIGGAAVSLLLAMIPLWGHGDWANWGKSALAAYLTSATFAYVALLESRRTPSDSGVVSLAFQVGMGSAFLLTTLLILSIFNVINSTGWGRAAGVLAVFVVGSTLLSALLRRLQRIDAGAGGVQALAHPEQPPAANGLIGRRIIDLEEMASGQTVLILSDGRRLVVAEPISPPEA